MKGPFLTLDVTMASFIALEARKWTPEEFERWFADTTCAQLLG